MRTVFVLLLGVAWMTSAPAYAGTVQKLRGCVQQKTAQLATCIRLHGKANADPCRTGIMMEVSECAEKFDAEMLFKKDAVRRKILFDACVKLHNKGTGQTAQQECDLAFPPIAQ